MRKTLSYSRRQNEPDHYSQRNSFVEVRAEGQHAILVALYERYGTRLCAHALNPTMHKTSAANTAAFNTASIMLPSTESRLLLRY